MMSSRRTAIPGTTVFDGRRSRAGLPLNTMGASLNDPANRSAFLADEDEYTNRYNLSAEQKSAVRERNWQRMIELGGNVYFICKIAIADGNTVPSMVAEMAGMTREGYAEMMQSGGRKPHG